MQNEQKVFELHSDYAPTARQSSRIPFRKLSMTAMEE